ncbi:hypothetical protein [Microvirga thermotolerans]|uniref:Uncharacterized protein n=1 Tax=Microvirga thermotolerans TaxID=2651334 RepID=A0A5P9K3Y1_9HYPH|nr:hypothetical protein [Microvirga thermotolerans]QFU17014.1 hypothetical protein GDR74_12725 [Microvirga thermotolerans]
MPYHRTDPNAYSGFTDPDKEDPNLKRGFYYVGCAPVQTGDIEVFLGWKDGPAGAEKRFVKSTYGLSVLYFLEDGKQQFIYGTIATERAKSDGLPIIMHTSDWVCALHKS